MAYIKKQPRAQIKTGYNSEPIALDGGVNRHGTIFNIGANEAWDCRNTTSKIPGALSVKNADTLKIGKLPDGTTDFYYYWRLDGLTSYASNIGSDAGSDFIIFVAQDPDNTSNYYLVKWNLYDNTVTKISCPLSGIKSVFTKHTDTLDYVIVANNSGVYELHNGIFTELTNAPKTRLYAQDDYRLFALKGNKLSWCDPYDINNWSTGDAGEHVFTDMRGESTAIVALNDVVYCFSDKTMHMLYGDDTGNYQFSSNVLQHGCVGPNAIATKDDSIYFVDYEGLKVYNSGQVKMISSKINEWLKSVFTSKNVGIAFKYIALGINDDYLYLSIPENTSFFNAMTYELNLNTGVWHKWDEGYYSFTKVGKNFYGMKIRGLYEIGTSTTHSTSWYYTTPMRRSQFNKQTISSIPVLVTLPTGSTLKVAYNTNDTTPSWTDLYTFTPSNVTQEIIIDVPMTVLNNNMMYQLKFYGTGPCVIHEIGSDGRVMIR